MSKCRILNRRKKCLYQSNKNLSESNNDLIHNREDKNEVSEEPRFSSIVLSMLKKTNKIKIPNSNTIQPSKIVLSTYSMKIIYQKNYKTKEQNKGPYTEKIIVNHLD